MTCLNFCKGTKFVGLERWRCYEAKEKRITTRRKGTWW